jgi:hypothetical protein
MVTSTSTAALTPQQQPQTPRRRPQPLDSSLDTSTAALTPLQQPRTLRRRPGHLHNGLDTSTGEALGGQRLKRDRGGKTVQTTSTQGHPLKLTQPSEPNSLPLTPPTQQALLLLVKALWILRGADTTGVAVARGPPRMATST